MSALFPSRSARELARRSGAPLSADVLQTAAMIVHDVRARGETALREHAERLGDIAPGAPLMLPRATLERTLSDLPEEDRRRLGRVAGRIREFAEGQRRSISTYTADIPGGRAGHTVAPVERAGCYAPGGRYPLPSSVLMTALTARVAGVAEVWVASPRPAPMTLAAAAIAGADGFVAAGGAQAIAALAFGAGEVPACDAVVGPGNAYVTAAKQMIAGRVAIDTLAGPSELVILADATADPAVVAADLLAQAEHDPDALPVLVSIGSLVAERVTVELERQLATLPTAQIAAAALAHGGAVVVRDLDEAVDACNLLAPEHLELQIADAAAAVERLRHFGALFIGAATAETFGDYGAGPNHVLPTGQSARSAGGLSVLTFLRVRTWLSIEDAAAAQPLIEDAAWLARVEGLEAHARSAERRLAIGAVARGG
ncbi:MAG TPA: histidinol dehydrogenase [Vicinamibacterales bacterium]|nr:histidinol dehydrogenase [Vicinamibacterales bacterium]